MCCVRGSWQRRENRKGREGGVRAITRQTSHENRGSWRMIIQTKRLTRFPSISEGNDSLDEAVRTSIHRRWVKKFFIAGIRNQGDTINRQIPEIQFAPDINFIILRNQRIFLILLSLQNDD